MKVLLLILLALALGVWWWRSRSSATRSVPKVHAPRATSVSKSAFFSSAEDHPFRAVSIKPGPDACAAAHALSTQRYLVGETPSVPVADCTERDCQCRYQHHRERRTVMGDRRAIQSIGVRIETAAEFQERRRSPGRRDDDEQVA